MPDNKLQETIAQQLRRLIPTKDLAKKGAITGGLILLLGMMFPRGSSFELDHKIGQVWTRQDLFAPFSFPISRDAEEYAAEVAQAKANVYPVFERDQSIADAQLSRLRDFFERLQAVLAARAKFRNSGSPADSAVFAELSSRLQLNLYEREWNLLSRFSSAHLFEMRDVILRIAEKHLQRGILDVEKGSLARPEIALRKGTVEEIVSAHVFTDESEVVGELDNDLIAHYSRDNDTVDIAHKIIVLHIVPNIRFNAEATQQSIKAAIESVPRTAGFVQEGDRIVVKNERITYDIRQKLESLRKARVERGAVAPGPLQHLGIFLHVGVVVLLFGIYLRLFRRRIFCNNRRLGLIAFLMLLVGFFAYLTRVVDVAAPIEYLILVPVASMLLTIIFDSRVGFYGTVIIAFLVAGIRGNDYAVALAALVAGALSVYTVRGVRNRNQIIRSLGYIFLGYSATILALGMERIEPWMNILEALMFALTNSIISPVLTFGLLIFFERFARVTTDLTLIELSHFNHPLLKMLSEKAPGTYHHSMTMASLAEAAASAVGANEVLARVGALFHDVGKIEKPTYFVENQKGTRNRHDKLSPRMSSLIIQNHVKKGVSLAREHALPEEVIDFIPQHHGTTRIDYFYRKAIDLAENSDDETKIDEINEQDYRYPGPKPQTKETGILMLADSIEAAARTLEDPSPQKLESLIDDLFKKRFEEGELDESPLTLKDLTKIKKAFLGVLIGVYHGRVKYPDSEKKSTGEKRERIREQSEEPKRTNIPVDDEGTEPVFPKEERLSRRIKSIDTQ
ncbi:HDIG domain-containing protein [Sphingobacteriales bacterium CHB3]|nr:HDIG domain-containing protein [Sphingobacteriales bacterium CHB3]